MSTTSRSGVVADRLRLRQLERRNRELERDMERYREVRGDTGERSDIVSLLRLYEAAGSPSAETIERFRLALRGKDEKFPDLVPIFVSAEIRLRMVKETSSSYSREIDRLLDLAKNVELVRQADRVAELRRRGVTVVNDAGDVLDFEHALLAEEYEAEYAEKRAADA